MHHNRGIYMRHLGVVLLCAFIWAACSLVPPVPEPNPSPSPGASPITSPYPTPNSSPLPSPGSSTPPVDTECVGPDIFPAQHGKHVEEATKYWVLRHPERLKPGTECLYLIYWDGYYFEVVDILNRLYPVEAIVDNCGGAGLCGEIVVKGKGVKQGTGFSEGYHILVSSGCVRHNYGGPFRR